MKNILFVFDIDDTLTKSAQLHQEAFYKAMLDLGIKKIDSNWGDYLHHTDSYIFQENYQQNFSSSFNPNLIAEFETRILHHLNIKLVHEIAGSVTLINTLQQKGYGVCFATGSLRVPALKKLDQIGLSYNPKLVIASNSIQSREGIVSEAIRQSKLVYEKDFQQIISIGDGLWDLKTAQNLDLEFIGIGIKNKIILQNNGAKILYNDWLNFDLEKTLINLKGQKK